MSFGWASGFKSLGVDDRIRIWYILEKEEASYFNHQPPRARKITSFLNGPSIERGDYMWVIWMLMDSHHKREVMNSETLLLFRYIVVTHTFMFIGHLKGIMLSGATHILTHTLKNTHSHTAKNKHTHTHSY